MTDNTTFVLLSRSILDSEVFASQKLLKIWVWCLVKANYKDRNIPLNIGRGEIIIPIKRGQFLFGRFKAEEELFIDGSTIYKSIKKLEEMGSISIESSSQYSIITVLNYDTYQTPSNYQVTTKEQPSNNQVTTKEQPSNTDNKDNKDNKVNKDIYKSQKKFYSEQLELSNKKDDYKKFIDILFGDNELKKPLHKVLMIKEQVSAEQFETLLYKRPKDKGFLFVLQNLENTDKYTKGKKNLYLTINNWFKTDFK